MANPVVVIPGIGQSKVKSSDGKTVWPFSVDKNALLSEVKSEAAKMMLFRKDKGFSDKIAKIAEGYLDPVSVKDDGSSKYDLKAVSYESYDKLSDDEKRFINKMVPAEKIAKVVGENNFYYFAYNPFGEVNSVADLLDKFISKVKSETGSEKVDLFSVSLGGCVLRAYMMKYAEKKEIGKVIAVESALDGTVTAADALERKLKIDDPVSLLNGIGGKAAQLASLVKMVPKDAYDNTVNKVYKTAMEKLGRNSTMIWACVPSERLDSALSYVKLNYGNIGVEDKVRALGDYTSVFSDKAKESGFDFYVIAGYNRQIVPVVESQYTSSDTIIDVKSASLGATAARPDEKLESGSRLSPDGNVDASTCAFPDKTWFFYDMRHDDAAKNENLLSLTEKILSGEVKDVNSSADYPQFIK
jgi:pimeloyl-ACP methyl ester carboxylesterase